MAIIQKDRIGQPIGFVDQKTKKEINICQSIDITDECSLGENSSKKIIVDYADRKDKIIIGLHKMINDDEDVATYFFLTTVENISCFPDFYTWADNVGLKMEDLKQLIVNNAPVEQAIVE